MARRDGYGSDALRPPNGDADAPLSRELVSAPHPDEEARLRSELARRAVVERAKGVLMARHLVPEERAFEMLRRHARSTNRRLVDVARAVLESHALFAPATEKPPAPEKPGER